MQTTKWRVPPFWRSHLESLNYQMTSSSDETCHGVVFLFKMSQSPYPTTEHWLKILAVFLFFIDERGDDSSEPTDKLTIDKVKHLSWELNKLDCIDSKNSLGKLILPERTRQTGWMACVPETLLPPQPHTHTLTCDDTGEGAAHGDRRVRGGGPAKGRHDRRRPAERSEGGRVAVVAVVVHLRRRRVAHQGGVGPIVSEIGVRRRCICVHGPVLRRWSLVLFTSDATHCRACRADVSD